MRVPSVPGVFLHVQGRPAQWVISCWRDVGGERFRTTPVINSGQWRKLASLFFHSIVDLSSLETYKQIILFSSMFGLRVLCLGLFWVILGLLLAHHF